MIPDLRARTLAERFSPDTGRPLRLGEVWPARPMIHDLENKGERVVVSLWFRHHLRHTVEVTVRPAPGATLDPRGMPIEGLELGRAAGVVDAGGFRRLALPAHWTSSFARALCSVPWAVRPLFLELADGRTRRTFQWYLYLTATPPVLPASVTHHRWAGRGQGTPDDVAMNWIELPSPLSRSDLPPAGWVADGDGGPESTVLVDVFPVEAPLPRGTEAVGWNGALGGHDPRPRVGCIAVRPHGEHGPSEVSLCWWDTPAEGPSRPLGPRTFEVPAPEVCRWPRVSSVGEVRVIYDLGIHRGPVQLDLQIEAHPAGQPLILSGGTVRLGSEGVGHCRGATDPLMPGTRRPIRCWIDTGSVVEVASAIGGLASDLKLSLQLSGRPARGPGSAEHPFRTSDGPLLRLIEASDAPAGPLWIAVDLGSTATKVAVGFIAGGVPRVCPILTLPTRLFFTPGPGGAYGLATQDSGSDPFTDDVLYALALGARPHPACPDHLPTTDVARFHLEAVLLEVLERASWFPVSDADVVFTFPPHLRTVPAFVQALQHTTASILRDVVWPEDAARRLVFRESPAMTAAPVILSMPLFAGPRLCWVIDIGGSDTMVCGVPIQSDGDGPRIAPLVLPELRHRLTGDDLTRGFYTRLAQRLSDHGLGATEGGLPVPRGPEVDPSDGGAARHNQRVLAALAAALKCAPAGSETPIARIAREAGHSLLAVDGIEVPLADLLTVDGASPSVASIHREVLEPRPERGHPGLRFYIRRFLEGCRAALDQILADGDGFDPAEVWVVVAGQGSRLAPIADLAAEVFAPHPVVQPQHCWSDDTWLGRGVVDPSADLDMSTAVGAALFALTSAGRTHAPVQLVADTDAVAVPVHLEVAGQALATPIAQTLDLSVGASVPVAVDGPVPLAGVLRLMVPAPRGAGRDAIVIAEGHLGPSARLVLGPQTRLHTEADGFVLGPCSAGGGPPQAVRLARRLGGLPMLGSDRAEP